MYSSKCKTETWSSKQAGASKIQGISMSVRMERIFATRMLTRLCIRTRSLSAGELVWKPYLSGPETALSRRRARQVVELREGVTFGARRASHVLTLVHPVPIYGLTGEISFWNKIQRK